MHADEFLKEVLESPICPKGFEAIYKDFQHYQQLAMDTLNEFHRVCEKNGIPYQLAYGSLLGAIRDDGQIPWDYDIDVWVPYCEIPALIKALKKDLNKDYYFYCPEVDPKCRHYMMRLAPKGYRSEVLHVDVFYMIGIPDEESERTPFVKQALNVFHTRYYKLVKIWENHKEHPKHIVKLYLMKLKYASVTVASLDKQFYYLVNKYPFKDAKYCMSFCGTVGRHYHRDIWDTTLITNKCGEFRITRNYDKLLHQIYGDYKSLFALENRISELMLHYVELKKHAKRDTYIS